jgi:hypothetical protein
VQLKDFIQSTKNTLTDKDLYKEYSKVALFLQDVIENREYSIGEVQHAFTSNQQTSILTDFESSTDVKHKDLKMIKDPLTNQIFALFLFLEKILENHDKKVQPLIELLEKSIRPNYEIVIIFSEKLRIP